MTIVCWAGLYVTHVLFRPYYLPTLILFRNIGRGIESSQTCEEKEQLKRRKAKVNNHINDHINHINDPYLNKEKERIQRLPYYLQEVNSNVYKILH